MTNSDNEQKPDTTDNKPTFNGKVAAIAIAVSAASLTALSFSTVALGAATLFILGLLTFGVWAFADEMGLEKPLVRAGMTAFIMAIFGRVLAIVGTGTASTASAYILYALAASISVLLWSAAFLHRENIPKATGAVGAIAGLAPVSIFIWGHVAVGVAVVAGSTSVWTIGATPEYFGIREANIIDYIVAAWGLTTSWLLWTGRIVNRA